MECNKAEATRAKSIAEAKLDQKDYAGSRRFALTAQTLFPELDGISQMLTTLDVILAAERNINGDIDWYRVLGVDPMAEVEVIKKKYRKLALVLHPDKNRLPCAGDAFKLINDGWTLLSDETYRLAHDLSMGVAGFHAQDPTLFGGLSASHPGGHRPGPSAHAGGLLPQTDGSLTRADGPAGYGWSAHHGDPFSHNDDPFNPHTRNGVEGSLFSKLVNRKAPAPEASSPEKKVNVKPSPSSSTFWTACCDCDIRYEYDMMYHNKLLLCIDCQKPFLATEIPHPGGQGRPVEQHIPNKYAPPSANDGGKNARTTSDADRAHNASKTEGSSNKKPKRLDDKYSGASMEVPDPDFYNFDRDRTEQSFAKNQVWAVYDDDDGMPRLYAMVHRVLSRNPFELEMSWLNSKTTLEFGPLDWVASGFPKTCGDFRIGKYEVCGFVNAFSHRVRWTKGARGAVVIFPNKGEVWALYRNWSPEWGVETPEDVVHEYEVVWVVEEYKEAEVSVAPLEKVGGYRTVFQPRSGVVMRIVREEMFRFSHRVPHQEVVTPGGCLELDPAALPMELLQRQ
ncbi:DNAJ heat shock N-terminal domain-containing protein [Striga hermonthica]|uniref:DNAJ heat shock N-terminal domain-containing protein n=1 Tax=Striga hermonthica TaxID=68872 RepID=A0A9N7RFW1_STRHE|nr:DNAJ heat shock N-terminal domain-containing protein [Striga hermonthica]